MDNFTQAAEGLAVSPEKSMQASEVIYRAKEIFSKFRTMGEEIQELRRQADEYIADEVAEINVITAKIDELNDDIIANNTIGRDLTDLKDQRDRAG